jgi:hypothetical protein
MRAVLLAAPRALARQEGNVRGHAGRLVAHDELAAVAQEDLGGPLQDAVDGGGDLAERSAARRRRSGLRALAGTAGLRAARTLRHSYASPSAKASCSSQFKLMSMVGPQKVPVRAVCGQLSL